MDASEIMPRLYVSGSRLQCNEHRAFQMDVASEVKHCHRQRLPYTSSGYLLKQINSFNEVIGFDTVKTGG